jgi:DNA-binding response OmpR family regulator
MTLVIPHLTPTQQIILDTIAQGGNYARVTDIIDRLYGEDEEGGPLYARECVRVTVHRLRRKLKPYGIEIRTVDRPGRGGGSAAYILTEARCQNQP